MTKGGNIKAILMQLDYLIKSALQLFIEINRTRHEIPLLLDTNILIALMRESNNDTRRSIHIANLIYLLLSRGQALNFQLLISTASLFEIWNYVLRCINISKEDHRVYAGK